MPSEARLAAFVAAVLSNQHDQAIADFYTPDSTMQENQAPPRRGREANVAREAAVLARATVRSEIVGPVFVSGDRVVLRYRFRFERADGTGFAMEEIAYQRWDGDYIAEEQFFYDPAQRN
ncbi:MAG TPA: nuclear transport factor 2 family protein [Kofleriaceae bacterium]|jgi:hypothetical protein